MKDDVNDVMIIAKRIVGEIVTLKTTQRKIAVGENAKLIHKHASGTTLAWAVEEFWGISYRKYNLVEKNEEVWNDVNYYDWCLGDTIYDQAKKEIKNPDDPRYDTKSACRLIVCAAMANRKLFNCGTEKLPGESPPMAGDSKCADGKISAMEKIQQIKESLSEPFGWLVTTEDAK